MPNYVTNLIYVKGDRLQLQEMMEQIKNDEYGIGSIDFQQIIPRPESLDIEASNITEAGMKKYDEFVKLYAEKPDKNLMRAAQNIPEEKEREFLHQHPEISEKMWANGRIAWNNVQLYGCPTWYEWDVAYWGTKWNAHCCIDEYDKRSANECVFGFQTAWSAPHPVIEKLASTHPTLRFVHQWADEDIGSNCGTHYYSHGKLADEYYPTNDADCITFAASVMGSTPQDYGLYLNASGNSYIYESELPEMTLGIFQGDGTICSPDEPVLFTKTKTTEDDIIEGLCCYDFRTVEADPDSLLLERDVSDNYFCSMITRKELNLGEEGFRRIPKDALIVHEGKKIQMYDFLKNRF